jgi:lysophospholipase L1-like esterase
MLRPLLAMLAAAAAVAADWREIPLDDVRLRLSGTLSSAMVEGVLVPRRFDPAVAESSRATLRPDHAATTSGVALHLRSDGAAVRLAFAARPGIDRGQEYAWFLDGVPAGERSHPRGTATAAIELPATGRHTAWTVAWPSWATVALARVEAAGDDLLAPPPARARLLAVGDSISHGTGQGSGSARTWPWLCAQALGLELHNLAVGGSMATPAVAKMTAGLEAEVVTVLYGFNDWNREGDLAAFRTRYRALVDGLAGAHPRARLVCIQPTASTRPPPDRASLVSLDDYRRTVAEVAAELRAAGRPGILVLDGSACTGPRDLADEVHLTPAGAERLARAVAVAAVSTASPTR